MNNAAVATEIAAEARDGNYSMLTFADLDFEMSPAVTLAGAFNQEDFCLDATHASSDDMWHYDGKV